VVSPAVSVIVPTRNRCGMLSCTLQSVFAQELRDIEVIVVDDASSDDTPALLAGIDDERLHVLRLQGPEGVATARNTGIQAARGRWIAFIDDDDLWAPDKLSLQLAALAISPGAHWSCVAAVRVDSSLRLIGLSKTPSHRDVATEMLACNVVPGGASGVVAGREFVLAAGGFDPRLSILADWDLWIRLGLESPLGAVDLPLLAYRVHASRLSADIQASRDELTVVANKYEKHRRQRRVELNELTWAAYFAELEQRASRRRAAFSAYRDIAVAYGKRRAWLLAIAAGAWPGSIRLRDLLRRQRIPLEERCFVDEWLAPIQSGVSARVASATSSPSVRR
jgi:glycosyltransferase involved in cell wall biosynthesis